MIQASPHGSMGNPILVEDIALSRESKFLVEAESMGLGMEPCMSKAALLETEDGALNQDRADPKAARFRPHRDTLDFPSLTIEDAKSKRAGGLITDPCQ
jgi:hypothetical protein